MLRMVNRFWKLSLKRVGILDVQWTFVVDRSLKQGEQNGVRCEVVKLAPPAWNCVTKNILAHSQLFIWLSWMRCPVSTCRKQGMAFQNKIRNMQPTSVFSPSLSSVYTVFRIHGEMKNLTFVYFIKKFSACKETWFLSRKLFKITVTLTPSTCVFLCTNIAVTRCCL
jgi:hypothetical protein